jgi:primosomal protein N' (replication factor Y)
MPDKERSLPGREEEAMPAEWLSLQSCIEKPTFSVFLLLGALRRHRTWRYQRLLDLVLSCQKGALLLVPEIELASSWRGELASLYGNQIASLHSGLSLKDREREWSRIQEGKASLVIGTRSAVFTPHPRLGLIVIDDEHDPSFKQEDVPRFHAREVALARAKLLGIPVILASATPTLESFYKAEQGEYELLTAANQEQRDSRQVSLADMRIEPRERGRAPLISATLRRAMEERVAASERVVLLMNRRGYFGHLRCRECGSCLQCPQCSVPLVLHRAERKLICHRCGKAQSPPDRCPYCRGVIMSYFGPGTQQLEEEVRRLFPKARVARLDRDALRGKTGPRARMNPLSAEGIDILVGTQMVLKAPDLQRASLVGVLLADSMLSLPDFRAGERLFGLLMETIRDEASAPVGRRSGRTDREVIIQTYNPGHYVLQALKAQDYLLFYQREIESRRALSLPPFFQLAHLEISAKTEERARRAALALASLLRAHAPSSQLLEGPAPSPLSRLRGRYRWRLLAKGERGPFIGRLGQALERFQRSPAKAGATIRVDIDPLRLY